MRIQESIKKTQKRKKRGSIKNVVVLGGGTGSFAVLSGLRDFDEFFLTALITMMDSGGSTGRLRDQLGVLPPGDLRQALVALSSSRQIWRDLFMHRFDTGDLEGHNFGNIFLSALEKITGSIEQGLTLAMEVLRVKGNVVPITLDDVHLCVRLEDDTIIEGEEFIDLEEPDRPKIVSSFLSPKAEPNIQALKAIEAADVVILGPGDLYTSIIPNLVVEGIQDALNQSSALFIYISNLMTKVGQTDTFTVRDHVNGLLQYMPGVTLDYVIVNNKFPEKKILDWYKTYNASLVLDDTASIQEGDVSYKVVRAHLTDFKVQNVISGDKISRSIYRHDPQKLGELLYKVILGDFS